MHARRRRLLLAVPLAGALLAARRADPDAPIEGIAPPPSVADGEHVPAYCELAVPPRRCADAGDEGGDPSDAGPDRESWRQAMLDVLGKHAPDAADRIARLAATLPKPRTVDVTLGMQRYQASRLLEATRLHDVAFDAQNLDEVVACLRNATGLSFHITPRVRRERFDDLRITISRRDTASAC